MENKNKINLTDSTVTSESGCCLIPITAQENVLNESAVAKDLGLETTPSLIDENNLTQSVVISNVEAKSTPVVTKIKGKEYSMDDMFKLMKASLKIW